MLSLHAFLRNCFLGTHSCQVSAGAGDRDRKGELSRSLAKGEWWLQQTLLWWTRVQTSSAQGLPLAWEEEPMHQWAPCPLPASVWLWQLPALSLDHLSTQAGLTAPTPGEDI